MMRRVAYFALSIAAAACTVGTVPKDFLPALMPNGARGQAYTTQSGTVKMELLAVGDSSLTVLTKQGVTIIEYRNLKYVRVEQVGILAVVAGGSDRDTARLLSRFPGGITPEIMAQLLASSKQTEPIRLTRGP